MDSCSDLSSPTQNGSSGIGFYRGNVVFMKKIYKKNIDLTRNIRKELIQVSFVLPLASD